MKRSEMVDTISDMISSGASGDDIVDFIEQAGMLPPPPINIPFPAPVVISDQWESEVDE